MTIAKSTKPHAIRIVGLLACTAMALGIRVTPISAQPSQARGLVDVYPGPHAIQAAVNGANAGDTLNIHAGTYREHVNVPKTNLTLQAAGDGKVVVDGQCTTRYTIYITAAGVSIDGLTVKGADEGFGPYPAEVNFESVSTGSIRNSVLRDSCNAEYGVNVYNSGAIAVSSNKARGFSDAGVYIGNISSTGSGVLLVQGNESYGNSRGVIVEDSVGGIIKVIDNLIHDNTSAGIFLTNSDGVRVKRNTVTNNGNAGIDLDANSDGNQIIGNSASGHTYDLRNEGGASNCWQNNTYTTSQGTISC
jgi:parallel beta-helix repeat protein